MSITITCEFNDPYQARQAAQRLRRRGYTVSGTVGAVKAGDNLLVAHPFGTMGGNTFGNSLMGALPPLAENGVAAPRRHPLLSVLTDDTQTSDCKRLLEALGGRIIS